MAAAAAVAAGVATIACGSGNGTSSNTPNRPEDASSSGDDGSSVVAFYGAPGMPLDAGRDSAGSSTDASAESSNDGAESTDTGADAPLSIDAGRDAPMVVAFYGIGNPRPLDGG